MLTFLRPGIDESFPAVESALEDPNGLLAAGGDLELKRLLSAYRQGIFPWSEEAQPILWWSPDPRLVIWPEEVHVSRRLQRTLRQGRFSFSVNRCFARVIKACAQTREQAEGTWITAQLEQAFESLHEMGYAHSLEVWSQQELVGGIYGLAIGRVFFGESMFHYQRDASKAALVRLCRLLVEHDMPLLDCQVASPHLYSMGALSVPREEFIALLDMLTPSPPRGQPFMPRSL